LKIIRSDLNQSFILFWDLIEMLSLNSAAIGLLGALKGKGLNLSRYEYLKGLDYQGIVNFMRDNFILVEYRDKLEKGVESLEYFIRLSYLRSCSKFLRFLRGVQWEFIKTFLREYDVYNLKVIIRTIILGGLYPQRLYLFPFSLFYPQVPKFTTLEEVLKFLRREREYKKMVECGYQEYKRRGEYFYLELRMDKMWLSLLRDNSRRLDKRIFVKMEKWLAMIYIFWAVRLYHIQKRDKEDVLAVIDLDNPYLNTALLESVLSAPDLETGIKMFASSQGFQKLLVDDWESSLSDLFFQREIEGKIEAGRLAFLPVFKFVFQQRYYVENVIYLLNQKVPENV